MNIRPENPNQRHAIAAFPERTRAPDSLRNIVLGRVTIAIVTLFWLGQFGANTYYSQRSSPESVLDMLLPRALACVAGAAITLACIAIQERYREFRLPARAYLAIAFTIASAAALGTLNRLIVQAFLGAAAGTSGLWEDFLVEVLPRLWIFGSVYAMALAISYSSDVRRREEEITALRAIAQDTQLRALRSQLNPHFLFNALNSIAALIGDGRAALAEQITEDLADFLRITLSLDPHKLIPLAEEVSLQRMYLDIQEVRFPKRLTVVVEISPDVEAALVPNLILQPLIENSIKYAVARSTAPVTLRLGATAEGGQLRIIVEDDGGNAASSRPLKGNRIGLANVAARLSAHFGDDASLSFGPASPKGFSNTILIPLRQEA